MPRYTTTPRQRVNIKLPIVLVDAAQQYAKQNGTTLTNLIKDGLTAQMVLLLEQQKKLPPELVSGEDD